MSPGRDSTRGRFSPRPFRSSSTPSTALARKPAADLDEPAQERLLLRPYCEQAEQQQQTHWMTCGRLTQPTLLRRRSREG
jgi:hypothetical protein